MGRPESSIDPGDGPVARFAVELRGLREAAGRPGYRELARRAGYSVATLSAAAGGKSFPSLAVTLAYAAACGADQRTWEARWRSAAEELAPPHSAAEDPAPAPYRGLATFESADAEWFFGRRGLVDELLGRLSAGSFLAVFGASGSGKSSVLRAGVLPALEQGALPGSAEWPVILITPGEHPIETLAARLANLTGGSARSLRDDLTAEPHSIRLVIRQLSPAAGPAACVVLVVDQFEEIFTICRDGAERARFLECLLAVVGDADGRGKVVLGARADFYGRCGEQPALAAALCDRQVLVGAMSDDSLREAVVAPAARAGLKVERALVEVIVGDARGEPGALPLVSHALLETWRRRKAGVLTLAGYRAAGGIHGGIARTAERVFAEFDPARQRIARQVFLRLTALGDGTDGTEDTRRRVHLAELLDGPDRTAVSAVLDRLAAARLVTVGQDEVQVAHEAVIRHWPRLRGWLTDDRDLLRARRHLTQAAAEWRQHGGDEGLLYRGARLAAWDNHPPEGLNTLERAFLTAARRRRRDDNTARHRRVRLAATGLISAVAAMGVLAAVALGEASRAAGDRNLAEARGLAGTARDYLQIDPAEAVRLARRAYEIKPTEQAEDVLRQATLEAGLTHVVARSTGPVSGVAFSRDGGRLAIVTGDRIKGRGIQVGRLIPQRLMAFDRPDWWQGDATGRPAFHPDGRHLATVSQDGHIDVWDTSAPSPDHGTPVVRLGHTGEARSIAVSPDGRLIAAAESDGAVRVWDWGAANPRPAVLRGSRGGRALTVAYSPDGRRIAAGCADGTVRVWSRASPRGGLASPRGGPLILRGHKGSVTSVAFGPDGRRLVSGGDDGVVRVWDAGGPARPAAVLLGHTGPVGSVGYSPDGWHVVSGGDDGTIRIWDASNATHPQVIQAGHGKVWSVAYAPGGRTVAGGSDDGTTQVWDVTGSGAPTVLRGHTGPVWDVAVSPDGREVAGAGEDGTVRVRRADGTGALVILKGHARHMLGVAFSPNGRRVAGSGDDGTIRVWNADGTGDPITLSGLEGPAWDVAFSADGSRVMAASSQSYFQWDAYRSSDKPMPVAETVNHAKDQSRPPAGEWSARAAHGVLRTYQMARRDPGITGASEGLIFQEAMSTDGRPMASHGIQDDTVHVWNPAGTTYPVILHGHENRVRSVALSADGRLAATTGEDDTVRIWKTTGVGDPIVFHAHGLSAENIRFAPDGRLVTTYDDGTIRLWRCEVCGPMSQVLALADKLTHGTSITESDRRLYTRPHPSTS